MKENVYISPESYKILLQVESVLCASVEKSFATNDFATITETDIKGDWLQ